MYYNGTSIPDASQAIEKSNTDVFAAVHLNKMTYYSYYAIEIIEWMRWRSKIGFPVSKVEALDAIYSTAFTPSPSSWRQNFRKTCRCKGKGRFWSEETKSFVDSKEVLHQHERHDTITQQYLKMCLKSNGSVSAGSHPRTQPYTSSGFHAQNIGASLRNLHKIVDEVNAESRCVKSKRESLKLDFEKRIAAAESHAECEKLKQKLAEAMSASVSSFEKITRSALKRYQSKVDRGGLHGVGDLNGHLLHNLCVLVPGLVEDVDHCNVAMVCSNNNTSDMLREEYQIDDERSRLSLLSSLKTHEFYGIGLQPTSVIENMLCEYGRCLRRKGGKVRFYDSYAIDKNAGREGRLMRIETDSNSRFLFTRTNEVGQEVVRHYVNDGHPPVTPQLYPVPVLDSPLPQVKTDSWWKANWHFRSSFNEREDWLEIKDLELYNAAKTKRSKKNKGKGKSTNAGKGMSTNATLPGVPGFVPTRWSAAPPKKKSRYKRFRNQVASMMWSMSSMLDEAESLFSTLEFQSMTLDQQAVLVAREACEGAIASHPNVFNDYINPYLNAEDTSNEMVHPDERAIRCFGRLINGNFKSPSRSTKRNDNDDAWVPSFEEAKKIMTNAGGTYLIPVYLLDRFPREMKHRFDCESFLRSSIKVRTPAAVSFHYLRGQSSLCI